MEIKLNLFSKKQIHLFKALNNSISFDEIPELSKKEKQFRAAVFWATRNLEYP